MTDKDKQKKLDKKAYKKMNKQYKKEFKQLAKDVHPFDFGYTLALLETHLKYMRDYYKLGYNVWGIEDKDWIPDIKYTRLEVLELLLNEYDAWQNCHEKYFIMHNDGKETGKGIKSMVDKNGKVTEIISDFYMGTALPTYKETVDAFNKEYLQHRKKFFKLLADHIEELWD